ncbi:transmembrane protein, putative (macronuclear) [Tetrahymena thermophila SB210]|uniref:Transmembrane protein, putative n=1 Tax=Tetrahymena thermophila (strain SB210) TaxID=312017 RepID=Q23YI7_TETTS|nr:transmembrane protein, putative [Tetrahymena thermophila SB210]EAS01585.1 transmembrane protein, putative [Tetrahymena thermophila SB210]|eukprot:XP_001021830.1 transmembrane protein, putative [Tetrahymena thermophila SB210]
MKLALVIISLISLLSIFTLSTLKNNVSLRSAADDDECFQSTLNLDTNKLWIRNVCKKNMAFKFQFKSTQYEKKPETFDFDTDCLLPQHTQQFELDLADSEFGVYQTSLIQQTKC